MNSRKYINKKSQYLSNNIEQLISKFFNVALNIFNYDPDYLIFHENQTNENIPQFVVSREYVWEFAINVSKQKKSLINKISGKLYKYFVIYFAMDDELVLSPYPANNGSLNNISRQRYPNTIKYRKRNAATASIIRFEAVIAEINYKLYHKVKNTVKHIIRRVNKTENEFLSSIKNHISKYFHENKRSQNNKIFDRGFFEEKSHYY